MAEHPDTEHLDTPVCSTCQTPVLLPMPGDGGPGFQCGHCRHDNPDPAVLARRADLPGRTHP